MCKRPIRLLSIILASGLALTSSAGAADPSLVCCWAFEGNLMNSGSTGSANDGTGVNSPTYGAGQLGQALSLNGTNQYVNCGTLNLSTNGAGGITLCAWINRPAINGDRKIIGNRNGNSGFKMGVYNGGNSGNTPRLEMEIWGAGGQTLTRAANGTALTSTNTWYHVVCVFDDTTNEIREYVNGVLDATTTGVTGSLVASTGTLRLCAEMPTANYYFSGLLDDVRIYNRVLSVGDIQTVMKGRDASSSSNPSPADRAVDVPRDVVLGWTPGEFAETHDVYFGTVFDDVNTASVINPKGALVSQGQDANSYDPADVLQLGQTCYWRVDEVNAAPDNTVFTGSVWSFTVEPPFYPIETIVATASVPSVGATNPQNTVNRSGLNASDQHSGTDTEMWLGNGLSGPIWIQYEFDATYRLYEMWVWNHNTAFEMTFGLGFKDVIIEYSVDGLTWTPLGDVQQFAQGPGMGGYAHNTTITFDGVPAKFVRLSPQSNWGGIVKQYGLSEVRFYYKPVQARQPQPASGATGVKPDVTLSWRTGREAASHQVFLSTDRQAVVDGTAPLSTTSTSACTPAGVNLGMTYYWKVNEVNTAETVSTWEGPIWSFTTADYLVIDGFESYTNDSPNRVFQTWIDGAGFSEDTFFPNGNPGNGTGSLVGYDPAVGNIMETAAVHGGTKSMPFEYGNTNGVTTSEATRTFDTAQDWTKAGIKTLVLYFHGDPNNAGQMYVKVNNTKIVYDKAEDIKRSQWQPWNIDLGSMGANLKSVVKLAIGVDGAGASGKLYFDDIRLYPGPGELITPVDPGTTGLAAWYKFDADFKDSAGTHHGTARGDAKIVSDPVRSHGVTLDGVGDAVAVPLLGSGNALTIAMWVNTAVDPVPLQFASFFHANGWEAADLHWRYSYGKVNAGINGVTTGDLTGLSIAKANQWNHVAVTISPTEWALWLNGLKESSLALTAPVTVTLGDGLIGAWLGTDGTTISRNFTGKIDDARFYNRALSPGEIASLAGRTASFYGPR
jgi:hypothetical protein